MRRSGLVLALLVLVTPPAIADSIQVTNEVSWASRGIGLAVVGSKAYLVGGEVKDPEWFVASWDFTSKIEVLDLATGDVQDTGDKLPGRRGWTQTFSDGDDVWIFGGVRRELDDHGLEDENNVITSALLRYDPDTGDVTDEGDWTCVWTSGTGPETETCDPWAPQARAQAAVVWDGRDRPAEGCPNGCAFFFGGIVATLAGIGTSVSDDIVRFNPETEEITTLATKLPQPATRSSAVIVGSKAYLFGGAHCDRFTSCLGSRKIVRVDLDTGLAANVAELPSAREGTSAVWTGSHALVFGGNNGNLNILNDIRKFDPETFTSAASDVQMARGQYLAQATWDGDEAFVVGGNTNHRVQRFGLG